MFTSATLETAIHLGQDYFENFHSTKNQPQRTIKQLFGVTKKLITKLTDIQGKSKIDWHTHLAKHFLLTGKATQLSTAKFHVFSDSVLCPGKMKPHRESMDAWKRFGGLQVPLNIEGWIELTGSHWNSSGQFSQDSLRWRSTNCWSGFFRTIISVNQLRVYGAVADMCDELASRISGCSASTGRSVTQDKSETLVAPTELSTTTHPLLTNESKRGETCSENTDEYSQIFQMIFDWSDCAPMQVSCNRILVKPQNQRMNGQDDTEEIGVKQLSYSQSAYDSAGSIATPPNSDHEDEQLRTMLASPLHTRKREENEGKHELLSLWTINLDGPVFSESWSIRETWC